jgi:predicted peroxiredoxin
MAARRLVVKVTAGADAPERCSQGLTVAATALAAGAEVSLWLTGEGTRLAVAGDTGFSLEHAADPVELLTAVVGDGTVTVCTQCAARRGLTAVDLRPGVRIAGAAAFVEEILAAEVQALVY